MYKYNGDADINVDSVEVQKWETSPVCVFMVSVVYYDRNRIPYKENAKACRRIRYEGMVAEAFQNVPGSKRADSMRSATAGAVVSGSQIEGAGKSQVGYDKDSGIL